MILRAAFIVMLAPLPALSMGQAAPAGATSAKAQLERVRHEVAAQEQRSRKAQQQLLDQDRLIEQLKAQLPSPSANAPRSSTAKSTSPHTTGR